MDLTVLNQSSIPKKIFYRLFGVPPQVFLWHPRFREYSAVIKEIKFHLNSYAIKDVAVFYDTYHVDFMRYCAWLNSLNIKNHYHIHNLLSHPEKLKELENQFTFCIWMIRLDDLNTLKTHLTAINKMLVSDGKTLIFIPNEKNYYSNLIFDFKGEFSHKINFLISTNNKILNVTTIHNNLTLFGTMLIHKINKIFDYSRIMRFIFYVLIGIPGTLLCFFMNSLPHIFKRKRGHCTNILVTLVSEKSQENDRKSS